MMPASADEVAPATLPGGAGTGFETRLRARALAGLFASGATLALLTVLLPHGRHLDEVGLLTIV